MFQKMRMEEILEYFISYTVKGNLSSLSVLNIFITLRKKEEKIMNTFQFTSKASDLVVQMLSDRNNRNKCKKKSLNHILYSAKLYKCLCMWGMKSFLDTMSSSNLSLLSWSTQSQAATGNYLSTEQTQKTEVFWVQKINM